MLRVAIIGGGPAASAAAVSLLRHARPGFVAVTIVEARAFPRSKVCGEFISPAATRLLEALAGPEQLRRAGAQQVHRFVLELGDRECVWPMPTGAWTLSRRALDGLLLHAAMEAGAEVLQPEHVRGVEYAASGVLVRLAGREPIAADVVVHADGSGRHDPAGPVPARPGVIGLKCYLRPPQPIEGIRMRCARGAYIGTVSVEDGLVTLALVARADLLRSCGGDPDHLLHALWTRFDPNWRVGGWLSCGVQASRFIAPGHARSFRIGNAAAAVEPVGGEGIGLALWAGHRLGQLFAPACERVDGAVLGAVLRDAQRQLAQEYRGKLLTRRPSCHMAAAVLMRPRLVRALWPLIRVPTLTIRPWYHLTGKPSCP